MAYSKTERLNKGKSLLVFPSNYTVVDIETTGMSASACEILEISAIRFRDCKRVSHFTTLVKPTYPIPRFITYLTGITNAMVRYAPDIAAAMRQFYDYVSDDLLMGYNVNFDVNFLYDNMMRVFGIPIENDFVDVLRFSRKALSFLESRSQTAVAEYYGLNTKGAHRSLFDCELCNEVYLRLRNEPTLGDVPTL